jgi:orotate phosphoribosyltransferase
VSGAGDSRRRLLDVVKRKGHRRFAEPVQLASGGMSRDFIDGKAALADGEDLELACRLLLDAVSGIEFDAIGGLTMGADQFAHVVAVLAHKRWFVVRKEPKNRGTNKLVEGAAIEPGARVVLVDDVVTTGGSIQRAFAALDELGARVVAAVTIVDRGHVAGRFFAERGIPYFPLLTYADLGIEPVGGRDQALV